MRNDILTIDAHFPVFTGNETPQQQIRMIYDYLFQMQQSLQYTLRNLGRENFNKTAMEEMQLVRPPALGQPSGGAGTTLGEKGQPLYLVGDIYINGVLWKQEESA
jgi:hypothetical protein